MGWWATKRRQPSFVVSDSSAAALFVPLAINEMVLAIWLLAKGFSAVPGTDVSEQRQPSRLATD